MKHRVSRRGFMAAASGLALGAIGHGVAQESGLFTIVTYNVWNGFSGLKALDKGIAWIREQNPDVVALQELVGINGLQLAQLAKKWNHPYAAILKEEGYPVGLTSKTPIRVVDRVLEGMHHGFLWVETAGIDFFVVHLSPHDYKHRRREANIICERIEKRLKEGKHVIALGDYNALSPLDLDYLASMETLRQRFIEMEEEIPKIQNLVDGRFDFKPMQRFMATGLRDACWEVLQASPMPAATFPTRILGPEQTDQQHAEIFRRIDYVLMDPALTEACVEAVIPRDEVLDEISDHYPVVVRIDRSK